MDVEINLKVLLRSFLKHIWLIALITILVTLGTAAFTAFLVTPTYEATTVAHIWLDDSEMQATGKYDYATKILKLYVARIKSDETMNYAADLINDEDYTPEKIRSVVDVESTQGDPTLHITAKSSDPDQAINIANKVSEAAAYTIDDIATLVEIETATITSSSPSLAVNCVIGFLASAVLSFGICLFVDLSDTKITSEEQLANALDVPLLGAIPMVEWQMEEEKRAESNKSQVQRGTKS